MLKETFSPKEFSPQLKGYYEIVQEKNPSHEILSYVEWKGNDAIVLGDPHYFVERFFIEEDPEYLGIDRFWMNILSEFQRCAEKSQNNGKKPYT